MRLRREQYRWRLGLQWSRVDSTRSRIESRIAHPNCISGTFSFTRIDDTYEQALDAATVTLSQRYGMDFRKAAQRYCALGPPQRVVESIVRFYEAGVRHVILDFVGPYEERDRQIERFASEALPLLAEFRGSRSK